MDKEAAITGFLPALLSKVKDKELREFIMAYAHNSRNFETEFLLQFIDRLKATGMEKYNLLLQKIVQPESSGEINFQLISNQLNRLLDQAETQLSVKNYLDPFQLAVAIITTAHPLLPTIQASSSPVHLTIIRAFALLENIVHLDAGPGLREALFEVALQEAVKSEYRKTGLEDHWFGLLLASSAADPERQQLLLNVLDRLIHEMGNSRKVPINEQYEEYFLRKKMQVLLSMGNKYEAEKIIKDNLRIKAFRRQQIDNYILKKDFESAKELIKESKRSDLQKGRLNASSEWDELLLNIARAENDVYNIRQAALRLFYDQFNMQYYRIAKATFDAQEWKTKVEKIIIALRAEQHFGIKGIQALADIYVEEAYWERLLQLLQKNASLEFAEIYFDLLKDKFPHEIVDIYKVALRRYAEQNLGREHYVTLVKTLLKIQSLPTGVQAARSLTTEFKVKYSQRRNMVKALNKLVF